MEKIRKYILISSITSIIIGAFFISYKPLVAIIEILLGLYLFYMRKKELEELNKNKRILSIIAVIMILCNIIGAIFMLLVVDSLSTINKEPVLKQDTFPQSVKNISEPKKQAINPELKRIDSILKLGAVMVIISGVLFATSNWEIIKPSIKVLILMIMGIIFFAGSNICKEKLHIESTSFTYWILAMIFFNLTVIVAGNLQTFGEWLSYTGDGYNLMYAVTYGTIALTSYLSYKNKEGKLLIGITYASILTTIYNILRLCTLNIMISISILTILLLLTNLVKEKIPYFKQFVMIFSIVLAFLAIIIQEENMVINIIAYIINLININYQSAKQNNKSFIIGSTIYTYIIAMDIMQNFNYGSYELPIKTLIYTLIATILRCIKINKSTLYQNTNTTFYYILTILLISQNQFKLVSTIIASLIVLIFNIISEIWNKNDLITTYIQPVAIYAFIVSLIEYTVAKTQLSNIPLVAILSIIYTIIYHYAKNQKKKEYFNYISLITTVLALYIALITPGKIAALITLGILIYHYITKDNLKVKIPIYLAILANIYIIIITTSILPLPIAYNALVTIWIYILIKFFLKGPQIINDITSIAIVIPAFTISNNLTLKPEYNIIMNATLAFYIVYLISTLLINKPKQKNIFSVIFIAIIILSILDVNLAIGLYLGVVGIIIMMIGYNKQEYKSLFPTGIIIIIINIIYQLNDLWEKIPFSLYLLFAGLSLMLFVTYKEIKKEHKKLLEDYSSTAQNKENNQIGQTKEVSSKENPSSTEEKFTITK